VRRRRGILYASVQDERGSELRTSTLPDDDSAWDYGEAIIRTLLASDLPADESRLMVIEQDNHVVASIAFNWQHSEQRGPYSRVVN
jgi:hypothetical protein